MLIFYIFWSLWFSTYLVLWIWSTDWVQSNRGILYSHWSNWCVRPLGHWDLLILLNSGFHIIIEMCKSNFRKHDTWRRAASRHHWRQQPQQQQQRPHGRFQWQLSFRGTFSFGRVWQLSLVPCHTCPSAANAARKQGWTSNGYWLC